MMRTQIYLPKSLYQRIGLLANQANKPTAAVVRELLVKGLEHHQEQTIGQALGRLVTLGAQLKVTGPTDLSTNLDHYLYDEH